MDTAKWSRAFMTGWTCEEITDGKEIIPTVNSYTVDTSRTMDRLANMAVV